MEFTNKGELYKEVLRTMSECVLIHEKSGNIVALNENVEKVLGIQADELSESALREMEFLREDGSTLPFEELPGYITIEQGISFHNFTFGVSDEIQGLRWLSLNSTPLRMGEDGSRAALLTISDITERKQMNQAIVQAKEEAEKANIAKSEFLSRMSHELRTPLNGILGFAQLLEMDQEINEEQRDFVQEILAGGSHLLSLINDILDLSRIETGKLRVSVEEVDLSTIMSECINIVQPLLKKKNLRIIKQFNQIDNTIVLADPVRLKQILLNLLDNAVKYNKDGGSISITCQLDGDKLVIHVQDTGIGLSEDEYQKVFIPFYRAEGTEQEGTGIGLSLVKQLVQVMGGKISVKSQKGKGSDFFFTLPLPNELKAGMKWGEDVETHGIPQNQVDEYSLLYIEDNESNINLVRNILNSQDSLSLLVAKSGKEGIEIAQKEKVDLILLDLNLPDLHGFQVFEILKSEEKTKDIAVIAVSAAAMPHDIQQTLAKGFINYVTKPLHVKEFLSVIHETLNSTIQQNIPDQGILSTGPLGEKAVSAKTLQLSVKELNLLKEKNYTAAISMHYSKNDWSRSILGGLMTTFERMGIKVVSVTDARFSWKQQLLDLKTISAKNPDIIVSVPVNPISTSVAFQKAAQEGGAKLLFMDNIPKGLTPGTDYVSVVSADNYGNGIEAAHIMAEKLGGVGEIGLIYHDADFFATKQRSEAFQKTIAEYYPNIQIVDFEGFTEPEEGEILTEKLLVRNHQLNGIFVVWDLLAEGTVAAANRLGRNDLVITTIDLGANSAVEMARDGLIKGLGAQLPYQQGVAEAILAGYALLGKKAPPYVAVPALKVTRDNLLDAWKLVYNQEAPEEIKKYFNLWSSS